MKRIEVVVVGSINLDVSVPVDHLPVPGETVLGGDALWSAGGKGANQAVAAARLGRQVAMVGSVGADAAGRELLASLAAAGVDTTHVRSLDGVSTGFAAIAVSAGGENSIVVSPGANLRLSADQVTEALAAWSPKVVLAQLEVPEAAVSAIVGRAPMFVLNPAPARPPNPDVLAAVDVLVPNRGELATLVGGDPAADLDEVVDQARSLGVDRVVVTMGGDGALVLDRGSASPITVVPIVSVPVLDTTAAGDSFCGALVDGLLDGLDLVDAARWAVRVAAVTVTRRGAQVSLPTRDEVGEAVGVP